MMATKEKLPALLAISLLYCILQVTAICENTADTFYCYTTTRRISCSAWRDGVYTDCGGTDYSDEVHAQACTVPYSLSSGTFLCENSGGTNIPCSKYMDGTDDCSSTATIALNGADEFCRLRSNYATGTSAQSTYPCRNGTRISCYLFQDGKNDCSDNSDEGTLYNCPQKSGSTEHNFKCTVRNQVNDYSVGICQASNFKFDGAGDCTDKSDEALLIGGDSCSGRAAGIQCADIIPGSSCVSDQCQCDAGRISVWSGSICLTRIVDDPCSTSTDCSASMTGLDCNTTTSTCYCTVGYTVYNPAGITLRDKDTVCRANKLYEACTITAECSNVITHAECTSSMCQCNTDYLPVLSTNETCRSRVIDDVCDTTAQCNVGMQNAECGKRNSTDTQTVCICHVGAYENSDKSNCIHRVIDESCSSDAMCSLSPNTSCATASGSSTCQCKTPDTGIAWVVSYDKAMCAYGLGDLKCIGDTNCTLHFTNSICTSSICLCADTYYENGYKTCTQFSLGTPNCGPNDCTHIPNAHCDSAGTCQCLAEYENQNGACIYVGASTGCNFACQYPYVIILLVLGLLAIIIVLIILFIKKPWKKPKDEKTKPPGSVAPYSNGGPTYDQENEKPIWTLRPRSSNKPMYEHMHLQPPHDPEIDAFFSGGGLPTVETPDRTLLLENEDRKVRFEESVPPTPMTPGNIDFGMDEGGSSPIAEEDSENVEENDAPKGKGKKGKKGKKEKGGKKKKGKKGNTNNNAISTPDSHKNDDDYFADQFAIESEMKGTNNSWIQGSIHTSMSKKEISDLVDRASKQESKITKVHTLNRERSQLNLEEKLAERRERKKPNTDNDDIEITNA